MGVGVVGDAAVVGAADDADDGDVAAVAVKELFDGGSGRRQHHCDCSHSWGFELTLGSQAELPFEVSFLPRP